MLIASMQKQGQCLPYVRRYKVIQEGTFSHTWQVQSLHNYVRLTESQCLREHPQHANPKEISMHDVVKAKCLLVQTVSSVAQFVAACNQILCE